MIQQLRILQHMIQQLVQVEQQLLLTDTAYVDNTSFATTRDTVFATTYSICR